MENCRRAIGLRIKETKEVYEGEATPLPKNEQGTVGLGSILFSPHFPRIRICTVTQRRAKKKKNCHAASRSEDWGLRRLHVDLLRLRSIGRSSVELRKQRHENEAKIAFL